MDIVSEEEVDRTMEILKELSTTYAMRYSESEANVKVRDYMETILKEAGYSVSREEFTADYAYWQGDKDKKTTGYNIIARPENPDPNKKDVIIVSHYDSVLVSPGANDNGSGTAVNLACALHLKGKDLPFNPVFLFVDAEELGLIGSKNYVEKHKEDLVKNTLLVVNMDMVGLGPTYQIDTIKKESQEGKYALIFKDLVEEMGFEIEYYVGMGSDYQHFESAGIQTFGIYRNSGAMEFKDPYYHTPNDKIDTIDRQAIKDTMILMFNLLDRIDN